MVVLGWRAIDCGRRRGTMSRTRSRGDGDTEGIENAPCVGTQSAAVQWSSCCFSRNGRRLLCLRVAMCRMLAWKSKPETEANGGVRQSSEQPRTKVWTQMDDIMKSPFAAIAANLSLHYQSSGPRLGKCGRFDTRSKYLKRSQAGPMSIVL
jgi:hypothetical protein